MTGRRRGMYVETNISDVAGHLFVCFAVILPYINVIASSVVPEYGFIIIVTFRSRHRARGQCRFGRLRSQKRRRLKRSQNIRKGVHEIGENTESLY
jgi:hypothetical protein